MAVRPQAVLDRYDTVVRGFLTGVVAYATGYALTLAITAATRTGTVLRQNTVRGAGWLYYNSQFSDMTTSATGQMSAFGGRRVNLLTDGRLFGPVHLGLPTAVYHAVPVVVLTVAGFVFTRRSAVDGVVDSLTASGAVALGTTAAAALGTWLFAVSAGHVTVSPHPMEGVLMTGLFFPLLFGSLGGVVSARLPR